MSQHQLKPPTEPHLISIENRASVKNSIAGWVGMREVMEMETCFLAQVEPQQKNKEKDPQKSVAQHFKLIICSFVILQHLNKSSSLQGASRV